MSLSEMNREELEKLSLVELEIQLTKQMKAENDLKTLIEDQEKEKASLDSQSNSLDIKKDALTLKLKQLQEYIMKQRAEAEQPKPKSNSIFGSSNWLGKVKQKLQDSSKALAVAGAKLTDKLLDNNIIMIPKKEIIINQEIMHDFDTNPAFNPPPVQQSRKKIFSDLDKLPKNYNTQLVEENEIIFEEFSGPAQISSKPDEVNENKEPVSPQSVRVLDKSTEQSDSKKDDESYEEEQDEYVADAMTVQQITGTDLADHYANNGTKSKTPKFSVPCQAEVGENAQKQRFVFGNIENQSNENNKIEVQEKPTALKENNTQKQEKHMNNENTEQDQVEKENAQIISN